MFKKKEDMKKKTKAPTCGQLCDGPARTPLHHEDSTPSRHPATSRHLRYIRMFRFTPINPPGISWQLPIRRLPAIGSQLAEVMCTN